MNISRKKFVLTILVTAVLTSVFTFGGLSADSITKQVTATQDGSVKIIVNGAAFEPKNADGTPIYPMFYNNTTYLPLRAVANAAGMEVGYDGANKTITLDSVASNDTSIGGSGTSTELTRQMVFKPTDKEKVIDNALYYTTSGTDLNAFSYPTSYTSGLVAKGIKGEQALGVCINVKGYKHLTGEANLIGFDGDPLSISVYGYDSKTNKMTEKIGQISTVPDKATAFDIDVTGYDCIKIFSGKFEERGVTRYIDSYVLGNVKLQK